MHKITAEQLTQRLLDTGLLDSRQIESLWAELGTREVSFDDLTSLLLRKELLTNFQLERLVKGERTGYFYGAYKVLYLVGTGTFARVYRAAHVETNRIVAVKALRKRFREDKAMTEQFVREGKIGMKLRHPGIVPIYEVLEQPSPALVMEFIEGSNLREFFRVRKKLAPLEALRVAVDVLGGLDHAFHQGMTHRDLKMSNVLMTSRGRCKLVDFGLAGLQGGNNPRNVEETNPRTIDYAALERASGVRNNDPRSDLFFVGVILYNLLTGVSPIGESKDRLARLSSARFQNIKPITGLEPNLPGRLAAFVMQSLELQPEKRYGSAAEMYSDAKRILSRLEAGDLSEPESVIHADAAADNTAKVLEPDQEGLNKTVMIVESKTEMQDLLRDRLKKYGYRVLVFSDWRRAAKRFEDSDSQPADCVIFCAQYLGAEALEGFNEFGGAEATKEVPALLFADVKQTTLIKQAQLAGHRVLLTAPLKVRELREALQKLLRPEPEQVQSS
jgi:eukaryotic-like serine/threonine-protein kinase